MDTYYTVLGLTQDADHKDVRKAYIRKAAECHPDKVAGLDNDIQELARQKMLRINEAYEVLRQPEERSKYDAYLGTVGAGPTADELEKRKAEEEAKRKREEKKRKADEEKRAQQEREAIEKVNREKKEEERKKRLEPLLSFVKRAIPVLGKGTRWRESPDDFFDIVFRGTGPGMDRYTVYLKGYPTLTETEIDAMAVFCNEVLQGSQSALLRQYHTVALTTACLEGDAALREKLKAVNNDLLLLRNSRKTVTALMGVFEPTQKAFIMPFRESTKPNFALLRVPEKS